MSKVGSAAELIPAVDNYVKSLPQEKQEEFRTIIGGYLVAKIMKGTQK